MSRRDKTKVRPLGRAARTLRRLTKLDVNTAVGQMSNHYSACGNMKQIYSSTAYFRALNERRKEK